MSNVQFQADFPQITLGKKTKILLEIPEGTTFAKIAEIAQHRGERIIVQFGNPQMAMDFKTQEGSRPGLVATVNERGEVENVEREEEDENEGGLFPQDGDEIEFEDADPADELPADPIAEILDEEEDSLTEEDGGEEPVIDREQIEEFILREQPAFNDIPFNFSELLRRRREESVTWIQLAQEVGVPSTKLQSSYQVFKKRVARMMQEAGVA